jgi:aspartate oxidase
LVAGIFLASPGICKFENKIFQNFHSEILLLAIGGVVTLFCRRSNNNNKTAATKLIVAAVYFT